MPGRIVASWTSYARVDRIRKIYPWLTNLPRELYLIDGNSLVYRAFFALPETIATSRG